MIYLLQYDSLVFLFEFKAALFVLNSMALDLLENQLIDLLGLLSYFLDAVSIGTAICLDECLENLKLVLLKKSGKIICERRWKGRLVEIVG